MQRERFSSRLGFILISAGCAIGLGNVWRFPYVVGRNGGAVFLLIYLLFLLALGLPVMTMEFAVGRASGRSAARAFHALEPKGSRWHVIGFLGMAGNYLLMMFYTTISGLMLLYFLMTLRGDLQGLSPGQAAAVYQGVMANPLLVVSCMIAMTALGMGICSLGLRRGVERTTKGMMALLLVILIALAARTVTLPGAGAGLSYYLLPDLSALNLDTLGGVVFAALGQAFFTLSIGLGSMSVFGSYIGRERRLLSEALTIAALDTFVAFTAGLVILPACFAYGIDPASGPGLVFVALPTLFDAMPLGRLWGGLFFLLMIFAALSTLVAVFENLLAFGGDLFGWSRKKACLINLFALILLSLPCALGGSLLASFQPLGLGSTVMDLEDFLVSSNLQPLGAIGCVLFCSAYGGWGYRSFLAEANAGAGLRFPRAARLYCLFFLPAVILLVMAQGYLSLFP
jgi:NSS family neurotransmitter:Na+ symporter